MKSLPLIAGIVPLIAITIAHWLGADAGHLPGCIPYIEGCTSISATGRQPPGSFVFRAVELPFAAALVFIWYFVTGWLRVLGADPSRHVLLAMMFCGVAGALALITYTTFLGTTEPIYEFMRRFGIYFYFAGTASAQLLCSISLSRFSRRSAGSPLLHLAHWMLTLTVLPFALGILNLVLKVVLEDANTFENRIEWIATLMMQGWFVLLYVAWRRTNFQVRIIADSTSVVP